MVKKSGNSYLVYDNMTNYIININESNNEYRSKNKRISLKKNEEPKVPKFAHMSHMSEFSTLGSSPWRTDFVQLKQGK